MTELNPELIDKALREFVKPRITTNMSLDGPRAKLAAALSAVLPDIIQQAKADALMEAADDIERRINEPGLILLADKYGGFHAGDRHRAQREVDLLRARAAELREAGR